MSAAAPRRAALALLAGPAAFAAVELLFRPSLDPAALAGHPDASALAVRHTLAATAWIATWWFTEAVPIPATSLLPLVLFPLLGLGSAARVSQVYGHEIQFLFLGGFLLALAMERTGLHERIALRILRVFGRGRRALVLGFMVATACLSMWISNTATTVMLLPVALAVLGTTDDAPGERDAAFPVALLLGIAFAANIGGLGTPVGSPPNVLFQSLLREKTGVELGFGAWMLLGVPLVAVLLPVTWWLLVRRIPRGVPGGAALPRAAPGDAAQTAVMVVFFATVALWVTRADVAGLTGWGTRLAARGISVRDSTIAVAAALTLFLLPDRRRGGRILDWSVAERLPWGVLLLLGAGFAISDAFDRSGLTLWVGSRIQGLADLGLPDAQLFFALLVVVVAVSIVVTEFASNTASANILLPIVYGVATSLGPERFPPRDLMMACALACTTGFAVPAGTPPNALVFATERISIRRFVRIGALIDVLALASICGLFLLLR